MSGEIHDPESIHKGLSIIVSEGHRLSKMVDELLEFSRIEDRTSLSTWSRWTSRRNLRTPYSPTSSCTGQRTSAWPTPPVRSEPLIPGDPERLRQVFSNLLDNAAKHGGGNQVIETSVVREEDQVAIRIRDHGPGVAEKDLPHVKEKFYKGSSKARGNGIGLAVCDEIVARLGGSLTWPTPRRRLPDHYPPAPVQSHCGQQLSLFPSNTLQRLIRRPRTMAKQPDHPSQPTPFAPPSADKR